MALDRDLNSFVSTEYVLRHGAYTMFSGVRLNIHRSRERATAGRNRTVIKPIIWQKSDSKAK